jgi:hypothetical protein
MRKNRKKIFFDFRKDIDIAKRSTIDYSQECQENAEKETDLSKRKSS